ncbi:MAG TPA: type IX secretion system membrane protein PorP/SprF [Flavobacterium sp.]|nr:type IX secretion system membrane protein PorP/SprF [Flavobacterium sp.]
MKKTINTFRFLFWVSTLLFAKLIYAQQDAQFTQYMYNMSAVNPAYATDDQDVINIGGLYRAQWVGSVGGPKTGSLFMHSPLSKKVELGFSVINDNIGDVINETNAYVDFAYLLRLGKNKLSLGLKGGLTFFETNFNGFQFTDNTFDPAFANNISRIFPNVGVGMYYFSDTYYVGLSAPNLLQTKHLSNTDGIYATGVEEVHYFFTGGYVFELSDNLKLKPAFGAKAVTGAPVSIDFTTNLLINDVFELGVAYRFEDSFSGLANFRVLPELRIGYAYDHTLSNLGRFNSGSHEIMVLFDLSKKGNKPMQGYDKSPRFF